MKCSTRRLIDLLDLSQQRKITARFLGDSNERLHIFRKTETSKPDSGAQESWTNARIEPHPLGDFGHVRAHYFAQIRHHVDE